MVAIERVFVHRNPDSALKLGQARGVALCAAAALGASVHEYAPRAIKLAVTGYGAAAKPQVAQMVRTLLALAVAPLAADAADALAAALCHAQHAPPRCARCAMRTWPRCGRAMIGSLAGRAGLEVAAASDAGGGGVGYELEAPMSTFYGLPALGERTRLLTHLVVREDAHVLYGFATSRSARCFASC